MNYIAGINILVAVQSPLLDMQKHLNLWTTEKYHNCNSFHPPPPPPLQWPTALNPPLTDSGISILQTTMTIGGALGLIIFFWCSATNAQALNPVLRATPTLLLLMIFCFLKANWIPERWYSVKLLRLTLSCLVNVVWLKQQHNGQED